MYSLYYYLSYVHKSGEKWQDRSPYGIIRSQFRLILQCAQAQLESCQSGRMGLPAKEVGEQSPQGFESLTLRQDNLVSE